MMFIRGGRLCLAALTVVGTLASVAVLSVQDVAGAQGSGGTLYVSSTGSDTTTCRLSTNPCATIAYAVTQANPGSTIDVAAGNYPQQLVINKNLTIVGKGGTVAIDPSSAARRGQRHGLVVLSVRHRRHHLWGERDAQGPYD